MARLKFDDYALTSGLCCCAFCWLRCILWLAVTIH